MAVSRKNWPGLTGAVLVSWNPDTNSSRVCLPGIANHAVMVILWGIEIALKCVNFVLCHTHRIRGYVLNVQAFR